MASRRSLTALCCLLSIGTALAPTAAAAVRYKTCVALRAKYPAGVGRAGAIDKVKVGQLPSTTWTVHTLLYRRLPKALDKDKDGIACELKRVAPPPTLSMIQPIAAATPNPGTQVSGDVTTIASIAPVTTLSTTVPAQVTTPPTPAPPPPSTAALPRFTNCESLNAVYPHGVGREGAVDTVSGNTQPVTTFLVDTALYDAQPKTLDRDKDGIVCERP